jgi:hypothetical protein
LRLRNYNVSAKVGTDIFEYETCEEKTLEEMMISAYRPLLLETRKLDARWDVYFADGVTLNVEEYDPTANTFKSARCVRLRKGSTCRDLRQVVAGWIDFAVDELRLLKCSPLSYIDGKMDLIEDDERRLKEDLYLSEYSKVYFERATGPADESPAFQLFLHNRSKMKIHFNRPPDLSFTEHIMADGRWTVMQLRQGIADRLGLQPDGVRLLKSTTTGPELKDDSIKLAFASLYDNASLAVVQGKMLPVGYYNVHLSLFQPTAYTPKIIQLPPLEELGSSDSLTSNTADVTTVSSTSTAKEADEESDVASAGEVHVSGGLCSADISVSLSGVPSGRTTSPAVSNPDEDLDLDTTASLVEAVAVSISNVQKSEMQASTSSSRSNAKRNALNAAHNASSSGQVNEAIYALEQPSVGDDEDWETGNTSPEANRRLYGTSATLPSSVFTEVSPERAGYGLIGADDAMDDDPSNAEAIEAILMPPTATVVGEAVRDEGDFPNEEVILSPQKRIGIADVRSPEKIEANDFAERTTTIGCSSSNFVVVEGLESVQIQESSPVSEVRADIAEKLKALGKLSPDASPKRIRIREKTGTRPDRILRDGKTILQNGVKLYDAKTLCIQILDEDEELGEEDKGDLVVLVQRWRRSTWSLEGISEVYLKGHMRICDIARGLSALMDIPVNRMKGLVVFNHSDINTCYLDMEFPKKSTRPWFFPAKELSLLREMCSLHNSDLLLLQDTEEPLKELSAADRMSIDLVEAAERYPSYGSYGPYQSNSFMDSYYYPSAGTSVAMKAPAPRPLHNGVKIKVRHKGDSVRGDGESSDAGSSPQSGANTPSPCTMSPSPSITALGEAETAAAGGPAEASAREIQKQGGIALFEDIM